MSTNRWLLYVRKNWTMLNLKFGYSKQKHPLHSWKGEYRRPLNLWDRYGYVRLYVPLTIDSAGYIDLIEKTMHPTEYAGSGPMLQQVFDYLEEHAG